jgi:hypothetical protein
VVSGWLPLLAQTQAAIEAVEAALAAMCAEDLRSMEAEASPETEDDSTHIYREEPDPEEEG